MNLLRNSLNSSLNIDSKAQDYSQSENKSIHLKIPTTQRFTKLGIVPENISRNEDEMLRDKKNSENTGKNKYIQEENFALEENNQLSFHTFNTSHLKDNSSFIDSSFNTMLNINNELEEGKGSASQLKEDLQANKLSSGYYKFRILVPVKGEII